MTGLIALLACCYALPWLPAARKLYGRWRGKLEFCYDDLSDGSVALLAMCAALVWPVAVLAALVMFRPPPAAADLAKAGEEQRRRIAELERELGLRRP
jgi:hypothetical protein